jgi:hypothetical protein
VSGGGGGGGGDGVDLVGDLLLNVPMTGHDAML